jgi:hypothetical protein
MILDKYVEKFNNFCESPSGMMQVFFIFSMILMCSLGLEIAASLSFEPYAGPNPKQIVASFVGLPLFMVVAAGVEWNGVCITAIAIFSLLFFFFC